MFGATTTSPRSGSTTPGTAMPTAVRSPAVMPPLRTMSSMLFSMAATTRSGPPFRGVGHFSRPMISPDSRTQRTLYLGSAHVHPQVQPRIVCRGVLLHAILLRVAIDTLGWQLHCHPRFDAGFRGGSATATPTTFGKKMIQHAPARRKGDGGGCREAVLRFARFSPATTSVPLVPPT